MPPPEFQAPDFPVIRTNGRQLPAVTGDALNAAVAANDPPELFVRGRVLVQVDEDCAGSPFIAVLSPNAVRGHLARVANWERRTVKNDGAIVSTAVAPPMDVVGDLMALAPQSLPFPPLERVVRVPVFAADGSIVTAPGYHAAGRVVYRPPPGLVVEAVPSRPGPDDIAEAKRLLIDELMGDFPFVGPAERAHALCTLLLPFARNLITGATPLHLFEAPSPGTGKGLLTTALLAVSHGGEPGTMVEGRDEDEWRKRITAKLVAGQEIVFIDNLRRRLESSALAAAVTAVVWEDRLLGHSQMVSFPVRTVWVATANNPALSSEMTRRTLRIRLDARSDRPWLRSGFRHPDLASWTMRHRPELIRSALVLIQAWVAAGRRPGEERLGSFESWAATMGGILRSAGVPGFLANLADFYAAADTELKTWRGFVEAWRDKYGTAAVGVADLYPLAEELGLGEGSERSQRSRLGRLLRTNRDRSFAGLRVEAAGSYQGAARWQIVAVSGESQC